MKPWTTKEIAVLRRLRPAGETAEAIARRLGRSRSSVLGQAFRLGIPRHSDRPYTRREAQG